VLSALSWVSFPSSSTYSVSKAAAWSLTNGLRNELRPQGTQVLALHVGYMDTDIAAHIDRRSRAPRTSSNSPFRRSKPAARKRSPTRSRAASRRACRPNAASISAFPAARARGEKVDAGFSQNRARFQGI
jgi:short-subunit dehydrogenase